MGTPGTTLFSYRSPLPWNSGNSHIKSLILNIGKFFSIPLIANLSNV